jgi:hypothetical protein
MNAVVELSKSNSFLPIKRPRGITHTAGNKPTVTQLLILAASEFIPWGKFNHAFSANVS